MVNNDLISLIGQPGFQIFALPVLLTVITTLFKALALKSGKKLPWEEVLFVGIELCVQGVAINLGEIVSRVNVLPLLKGVDVTNITIFFMFGSLIQLVLLGTAAVLGRFTEGSLRNIATGFCGFFSLIATLFLWRAA